MNKTLLLASTAVMLFASCSKDTVKEVNTGASLGNVIDFRTSVQTRAEETTNSNVDSIYVTALDSKGANYFTDQLFTKSEGVWNSNPAYHWPGDGSTLNFYAYAPAKAAGHIDVTITKDAKTIKVTPKPTTAEQVDFIVATASGSKADATDGVSLNFSHQLSQIEIQAKNANSGYTYSVSGIKIANAVSSATYNFASEQPNKWTLDQTKASYKSDREAADLNDGYASIMGEGGNAMLIPQQLVAWNKDSQPDGAYLAVKVRITTKAGAVVYPTKEDETHAYVAVPIDTNWEPGKKYTYKLDFSNGAGVVDPEDPDNGGGEVLGEAIKFTVNVSDWTPESNLPETEM